MLPFHARHGVPVVHDRAWKQQYRIRGTAMQNPGKDDLRSPVLPFGIPGRPEPHFAKQPVRSGRLIPVVLVPTTATMES